MRRQFIAEDNTTTPIRTLAPEAVDTAVQAPRTGRESARSAQKESVRPRKATQKPGGRPGLRTAIVLFSSLGLFSALVPTITGVPLSEWLQGVNFKAAYSSANFTYMRGTAAFKMGNLTAATEAVLAMSPESTEAEDLAVQLFPRLLDAGDYSRAAQLCQHMLPTLVLKETVLPDNRAGEQNDIVTQSRISSTVNLKEVGKRMVASLGPEKALALIASTPSLNVQRELLIPTVFVATAAQGSTEGAAQSAQNAVGSNPVPITSQTITMLEKLVPTLSGVSQMEAIKSLVTINTKAKEIGSAWQWSLKLPAAIRVGHQQSIMQQLASVEPELALRLLSTLGTGQEADSVRAQAMRGIVGMLPDEAPRLLESIKLSQYRDMALLEMVQSFNTKDKIELLDQMSATAMKAQALSYLMSYKDYVQRSDFLQKILPYFATFARQNPQFVPQHDDGLVSLASTAKTRAEQESFLNRMLNPAAKAKALQDWKEGKLVPAGIKSGGGMMVVPNPAKAR